MRVEIIHTGGIGGNTRELEVRLDNRAALGPLPITDEPTGDRIKTEDLLEAIREETVNRLQGRVVVEGVGTLRALNGAPRVRVPPLHT